MNKDITIMHSEKDHWKDFPADLANMIQTVWRTDGEYCVEDTIRYLMNNKVGRYDRRGNAKLSYVKWIIRFFDAMYPLYIRREESWRLFGSEIKTILEQAERYLFDLAGDSKVITESCRSEFGYEDESDLESIAQRLNFYFCTLYKLTGEDENYKDRLRRLLDDTKRNIVYLIYHEDAERLSGYDWKGSEGFYLHSFDYWQPIAWMYHEAGSMGAVSDLINIYEDYAEFLYAFSKEINFDVRNKLITEAENNLQWLYREEFDIMEDDDDIPANQYADYICELERKLSESELRLKNIDRENNITAITGNDCRSRHYHRKWKRFTMRLRELMEEYPTLPVVVFMQSDDGEVQELKCNQNLTRCEVAVANDPETGLPGEKIIAVVTSDPWAAEEEFLKIADEDIPF